MLEISDFICKDPSIAQLVLYIASALLRYEVVWGHIDVLVVAVRTLSMYEVEVKTLLPGPSPTSPTSPTSPMRRRLQTPYFQSGPHYAGNTHIAWSTELYTTISRLMKRKSD